MNETRDAIGTSDGRRFVHVSDGCDVEVVIQPVGRGIVVAMGSGQFAGTDWTTIELARLVGVIQDTAAPTLDDRSLRHAYAAYLCAFATPGLTPADVERWTRPWATVRPLPSSQPVEEEALPAAVAALGRETSIVLPPSEVEIVMPKPEHIAAARLGAEPHSDDDQPMSFTRFVEQLHRLIAACEQELLAAVAGSSASA